MLIYKILFPNSEPTIIIELSKNSILPLHANNNKKVSELENKNVVDSSF